MKIKLLNYACSAVFHAKHAQVVVCVHLAKEIIEKELNVYANKDILNLEIHSVCNVI